MFNALSSRTPVKLGNTEVKHVRDTYVGLRLCSVFDVYLHGNHIAYVLVDEYGRLRHSGANYDTFRNWPTATTRSLLRALGINASIKNHQACIDGQVI
jgi:hypothetical protein